MGAGLSLSPQQAFAAAKELRAVIDEKEKANLLYRSKFPEDRMTAKVRYECAQRDGELELLKPALAFLEEVAGK